MPYVDVNGARLWVEEAGTGPAVVFIHGALGDMGLWEPQAQALADVYRCVRFDQRFYGRSDGPGRPWALADDVVGVLDALEIDRAALVGLSMGGGLALDVAIAHPDRVWAVAHVAGAVAGLPVDAYTPEQEAGYEAAVVSGALDAAMEIDFAVWAPLGADDRLRTLWHATPDARNPPEGAEPLPRADVSGRLGEIAVPTLVVVATLDPPAFQEVGRRVARDVPGARLVEVDSDHYLPLRQPEQIVELLREFLAAASAAQ